MKITTQEITKRLHKYYLDMIKNHVDVLILTHFADIYYLSNFQFQIEDDDEAVVILKRIGKKIETIIVIPTMYSDQVKNLFDDISVKLVDSRTKLHHTIAELLSDQIVGFDSETLVYSIYQEFSQSAKKMVPLKISDTVMGNGKFRTVKSAYEISKMKKAQKITYDSLMAVAQSIKVGMTERQVVRMLLEEMENRGADTVSFDPIVATGKMSAIPHYTPSNKKIMENEIVLIDCGAKIDGYCGDLTRTFLLGNDERFDLVFDMVNDASSSVYSMIKSGVTTKDVDQTVRSVFKNHGVSEAFLHSTGHGVGIEIHEYPKLSHLLNETLLSGMVVTVEPGLYYPDWGGIRIEDMIVITDDGFEFFNNNDRDWKLTV